MSLIGILNYYNLLPCISVCWKRHEVSSLECFFYNISLSLLTGVVVYFFTVLIPQRRRNIIVQPFICTEIRDLENSYRFLLIALNSNNTNGECTTAKALLQGFRENCISVNDESIYFSDNQKELFSKIIEQFKKSLPAILKYEPFLSEKQIDTLQCIQNSAMHNCLKNNVRNTSPNKYLLEDVNLMAESMEDVYNKCHALCQSIDSISFNSKISIYKENKS